MERDALAARLRAVFLDELDEQVTALNADLLVLEGVPGDAERLRAVFRVAHTLKGAARAAGVPEVEALCHALEAMLSDVRDGLVPLDERRLTLSFASADALAEAGRRLRTGVPVGDATDEALHRLHGSSGTPMPTPPAKAATPANAASTAARSPAPLPAEPAPMPASIPPATTTAPATPAPTPPAPDLVVADDAPADERVRVAIGQIDALQASAAQLLGHATALEARPDALRALRDALLAWRAESRVSGDAAAAPAAGTATDAARDDAHLQGALRGVRALLRDAENDARQVNVVAMRLGEQARRLRLRPFGELAAALPRVVRDLTQTLGREVRLEVLGQEVEADRTVLDALRDPLLHLVRNAVDHGMEPPAERERAGKPAAGTLTVQARVVGERLRVEVRDDGRGLDVAAVRTALARRGRPVPADDREAARALFEGGISTRTVATAISGRGVGLDVVGAAAARLGGSVDVQWRAGAGTTFVLELPVSVATTRALVVDVGGGRVAVPTSAVQRVLRVAPSALRRLGTRLVLPLGDELLPVLSLAGRLGAHDPASEEPMLTLLLLVAGERRAALRVADVRDEREFIARPLLHAGRAAAARYSGVVLGDADDAIPLVAPAWLLAGGVDAAGVDIVPTGTADVVRPRVLVVDDSITTRALEASVLESAGFDVTTAVDGMEALGVLDGGRFDLVVTDIEMPRMDGITLCETIRRTPRLAALPVVVVTSLDRPEQRARGMAAGADAYVTKSSFDQDDFLRVARQLVADRAPA